MEDDKNRYAIGQQDFKTLRLRNLLYVDKTQFIEKILNGGSQYYFLARPRRFGKSLFLSSMRYFFEGQRDLFRGLHIDSIDWDWQPSPVLYLDLNAGEYTDPDNLDIVVDNLLREWEKKYEIAAETRDVTTRFRNVIKKAHATTGRQVVILVDEYDKPLVKNLNKKDFEAYREKLAALYSNFKTCADDIRLVFMTGVSRFSKLSVFSGLNNLRDITFSDEFADICGITEKELQDNFQAGINALAEEYEMSQEEGCALLKKNYDGYRFAKKGSDIYNPWSLLNCLCDRKISNYWNETGFPSLLMESLSRLNVDLKKFLDVYCDEDELKGFDLLDPKPLALMYQTGYLTIKDFNKRLMKYHLGIPNNEVKKGFFRLLLPCYVNVKQGTASSVLNDITNSLILGNPDEFMEALQIFFAGVPYKLKMDNENNFHNAFYLLMSLIGIETDAEVMTSDGRIDMVIKTEDFIYVIELKYDGSARAALDQINEKRYDLQFRGDSRRLIKIGVSFSSRTRRIEDWLIEQ
ncbi:MAG: ATP-binding protein [Muribaculaceae bacterium]|nr:ATP-binding protein [Muribaculaceae bacterium]